MRLADALEQSSTGALRRMASVHALVHDDSTTRVELIDRIGERLRDPSYLGAVLDGLADDERAALLEARATHGELRGLLVDREHPGAADVLAERGLLFRLFASSGPLRGEVFSVPDEVLALLPAAPAVAPPPAVTP